MKQAPYFMLRNKVIVKVATELICPLCWSNFVECNRFYVFCSQCSAGL